MLLDLAAGSWDDELLELFSVDRVVLPEVVPSSGVVAEASLLGASVPLAGMAGDQQAALFGQGGFKPGRAKATYGTGTFVLANVGDLEGPAPQGLLKTATAAARGTPQHFATEGSVLVGGAAVQWLRDGLGIIASAAETEALAREVDSTGGVFFVPALTGLGAPHWDAEARGLIGGLTRGTTRAHIVRATLEAIAHQVADVIDVLPIEAGVLRVDGGATANGFLMQFQADVIQRPVELAANADATALGAAALTGLAVGTWRDVGELEPLLQQGKRYEPSMSVAEAEGRREDWRRALRRAR
jgi:glycerol kinase